MQIKHLSTSDACVLLEIISDSLLCRFEHELKNLINKLNNIIPFQSSTSFVGRIDADGALISGTVINMNYPEEYMREYINMGFSKTDPLIIENFKNYRLQYWADTIRKRTTPKGLFSLAEDFGFNKARSGKGYAYGVKNLKGTAGSLFSFYGLNRDDRTEEVLKLVIPHIHEILCHMSNIPKNVKSLTLKETEILKWLRHGKSTWDISVILNISERTVKFHITNIMQKLDASNRAHAVAIAIEQGLVEIE